MQPPDHEAGASPGSGPAVGKVNLDAPVGEPSRIQAVLIGAVVLIVMIAALVVILSNVFRMG